MSEMKVILATPHPKMKNACDGAIEVYPKSDVDTVIEEKDRAIEFAKTLTLKDIEIIKEKDKEIAELKEQYKDMDVTHTVHIAKMNDKIEELEYNVDFWKKKLDKVIAECDDNQVCIDALKTRFKNDQAYIAELKAKLKQEQSLRSHWNEDDYAMVNESERLFNENAELKQKLQDQCISCPVKMQEDDVVAEKDNEIRKLKRALWLSRGYIMTLLQRDFQRLAYQCNNGDYKKNLLNRRNRYYDLYEKCRAKEEEYK